MSWDGHGSSGKYPNNLLFIKNRHGVYIKIDVPGVTVQCLRRGQVIGRYWAQSLDQEWRMSDLPCLLCPNEIR